MSLAVRATMQAGTDFSIDIDLAVETGEVVGLVGPNGSGKSTVLRHVAGLAQVARGSITGPEQVWDDPINRVWVSPQQRNVGFVPQRYDLFADMTAIDNVMFGLTTRGVDAATARLRATQMLERLGVPKVAGLMPVHLSGGEGQRVAIARALVIEPAVLILDEPTSALDAAARHDLLVLLGELFDEGATTALITSHRSHDLDALADRLINV